MKNSVQHSENQKPLKCERKYLLLSSLWLWLQVPGRSMRVRMNRLNLVFARVVQGVPAGLIVLLRSIPARVNLRVFVGLVMMGVVAPVASCSYMIFDRSMYEADWYYVNYFHLFLTLAPSLFLLSALIGVWFLFPYRSARAYGLIVPAGLTVGKILWLIQCTSNQDFYSVVPASFLLIGALLSLFLFIAFDWLVHNVFHREDAFERRIGTLYNGLDLIDGETFKTLFKKSVEEKQAFQKQF